MSSNFILGMLRPEYKIIAPRLLVLETSNSYVPVFSFAELKRNGGFRESTSSKVRVGVGWSGRA